MKPIAYINVEKRTLEFAEPIKWYTPTVANLDRIPLFTKEALAQTQEPVAHWSDCAVHSEPAYPKGECDCDGFATPPQRTEQEPVAYSGNGTAGREADVRPTGFFFQMPKPVTQPEPPQRKPLTIGDVKIIWQNLDVREGVIMGLVRAVEAAHGIKENT